MVTRTFFTVEEVSNTKGMEGYTLLTRKGYALVYVLAGVALAASALGTFLGAFAFGDLVWWPTLVLLLVVGVLEIHGLYSRRAA